MEVPTGARHSFVQQTCVSVSPTPGAWGYGSEQTQGRKKPPPSSAFNLERDGTGN